MTYMNPHHIDRNRYGSWLWPVVILVASVAGWYGITSIETGPPRVPSGPKVPQAPARPSPAEVEARKRQFFNEAVLPLLNELDRRNQQAAQRCLERIDDAFRRYRQGVRPFTEDVTSLGTRLGVLVRLPGAWWSGDDRIEQYIRAKFEQHIFSQEKLQNDISGALLAYREDVHANLRVFHAQVKVAAYRSDVEEVVQLPDYEVFSQVVFAEAIRFAQGKAVDSVRNGVVTLVVSEVASSAAGYLAGRLVGRVAASITSSLTAAAAGGGGATAGAGAAGAGAGSAAGPIGTGIGFVVGIGVGIAVDWWMTEQFRADLERQLDGYLEQVHRGITEGTDGEPGLRAALEQALQDVRSAAETALRQELLGEKQTLWRRMSQWFSRWPS